jgi:hypothetical protein
MVTARNITAALRVGNQAKEWSKQQNSTQWTKSA